ncbi:hypothetical protein JVT61DRAFT_8374 [Boletus reticuloceps]|uniref:Uncharacterized protein n=1 Tax=Boletus reticuloceps TaxID=495285 RepID=A0A8I2YX40_9AGAM|nr:hypothetical protein JVT61DRAFT_8374 [Boletus reticuloceps]
MPVSSVPVRSSAMSSPAVVTPTSSMTTSAPSTTTPPTASSSLGPHPEPPNVPSQSAKPDKGKAKAKENDQGAEPGQSTTCQTRNRGHLVMHQDDKRKGKGNSKADTMTRKGSKDRDGGDKDQESQMVIEKGAKTNAEEETQGRSCQRAAPSKWTQRGKSHARSKVPEATTLADDACPLDKQDDCDRCIKLQRTCVPIEG